MSSRKDRGCQCKRRGWSPCILTGGHHGKPALTFRCEVWEPSPAWGPDAQVFPAPGAGLRHSLLPPGGHSARTADGRKSSVPVQIQNPLPTWPFPGPGLLVPLEDLLLSSRPQTASASSLGSQVTCEMLSRPVRRRRPRVPPAASLPPLRH